MRKPRTAIAVAVAATTTALTFAAPAVAAGTGSSSVSTTFSVSTVTDDPDEDLRVAIAQLISLPQAGTEVITRGRKALNGTVEEMRAFLETGYRLAQAEDDRVALAQLISRPETTPEVRTAAIALLRVSDPEEMRWFLEVGQYQVTG